MRLPFSPVLGTGLAVAVLVVAACSDPPGPEFVAPVAVAPEDEPRPPAGLTVGVVLPASDQLDGSMLAQMEADVRRLASWAGPAVREARPLTPTVERFVPDLVAMLADRGTDLICVVGPEARRVVSAEARLHPEYRYCAVPVDAGSELPDQAIGLEVRAEELGFLAGVAARTVAGDGLVGVVLASQELPAGRFRHGLEHALQGAEWSEGQGAAEDAVAGLLASGARVVVIDGGPDALAAAELAASQVPVIVPSSLAAGDAVADVAVLTWRVRWDRVLWSAVQAQLGEVPVQNSHGLREDAFVVAVGPAATPAAARALDDALAELAVLPVGAAGLGLPPPPEIGPGVVDGPGGGGGDGEGGTGP